MNLEFDATENAWVRLEPLAERHRDELRQACAADPEIWSRLYSLSMLGEHFEANFDRMVAGTLAAPSHCYAVMREGRVVGVSCFLAIDEANRKLEIGATYYRPEARGGAVNPAAKRLLLERAFKAGIDRVYLNVDALNARSRAAVLKLGAHQDGILRHDRIVWTGRVRDTVVFSILAEEWPGVRARLDARLAAFG